MDTSTTPAITPSMDAATSPVDYRYLSEYSYDDYYNYTYDYEDAIDHLPLDKFIPMATVYAFIGLAGLVGNLLVIFAIFRVKRMRTITNLFLLSLSSADLLLVVVCVPVKGVAFYSYSWRLGEAMCRLVAYVQTVSMVCSALTLTAMSIERFVAIRYPLKARSLCTKRHARVVIIGVWCLSLLSAVPIIFGIEYRTVNGIHRIAHWCHKMWQEDPLFGKVYEVYMLVIILLIPVSVMMVTYTRIANIIWHVASHRADMRAGSCSGSDKRPSHPPGVKTSMIRPKSATSKGSGKKSRPKPYTDDDKTRRQVVVMLMVVVILFAVCWTPVLINNVLVAYGEADWLSEGNIKIVRMVLHILSYANSCVNPFVYAFMSKNFRDGFKQAICACVKGSKYIRKQMSARSATSTLRMSSSHGDKTPNGHKYDSIALRTDIEEVDMKHL